ncbi:Sed5 compartment vesicle of 26 kDa [Hyphodiscus hymeniophilus]|uniref:Sed5 compartment vesicle of 26 kDa n=1 Tax=Hyphodiscus hymeniophilus TaxID=353542 RepID=A0A9P6VML9_9HELO|nr:Sed5 compartment vesicle of 26 kDa [Hyphodiscus hymeniophilus]
MWILPLVGYMGMGLGFGFLTLAIASGLYYLSELVEEHTVFAKKLLTRLIYLVIGLQALLCLVDGFPFKLSILSIVSHVVYLGNMRRFPIVKLSDPLFVTSCILVLFNHYVWFSHFSGAAMVAPKSIYDRPDIPTFTEIASYFGLCVWLVPFSLFVSLSASDNVLPTMGSEEPSGIPGASGGGKNKRQGMAKVIVDTVRDWIGELGKLAGWGRPERGF